MSAPHKDHGLSISWRNVLAGSLVALFGCLLATALFDPNLASAQAQRGISLNDLALDWSRGNYATPIVCKIQGGLHRALRRILIDPGPKSIRPHVDIVRFVDLEVADAERCFTEIGGATPNMIGELKIRHPSNMPRDTAMRDFKGELKRRRGFVLDIVSGKLQVAEVGPDAQQAESVDFRGGEFRLHLLREGTDALKLLKDLPSPRQAMLEIETRAGRKFSFPVSLSKPKTPASGGR
jgi:hypothetical protein